MSASRAALSDHVIAWRATGGDAIAETVHATHVAVCDAAGALVMSAGDADYATPLRSCLKPIQAQALFLSGAIDRFAVTDQELALACASHDGAPWHTEPVLAWLKRMGLGVADLMCGAHPPHDADGIAALEGPPTALHNNCSGKHTGMLASALALGAPTKDYILAKHPVQALIREAIATLVPEATATFCVDGCSVPTPVMSVRHIATAFARFADGTRLPGLARTFDAMVAHPELVGGRDVIDTRLMRSFTGLMAKRGADGGYAIALRPTPSHPALGIALKVETGSEDARAPAVMAVLEALGALNPATRFALKDLARPARKNHRGLVVGSWQAHLDLVRQ